MSHIHSFVLMRSLDKRKYADKQQVRMKSEVVENFLVEKQNEKRTGYQHTWNLCPSYTPGCRRSYYPQGQLAWDFMKYFASWFQLRCYII